MSSIISLRFHILFILGLHCRGQNFEVDNLVELLQCYECLMRYSIEAVDGCWGDEDAIELVPLC